MRPITFDRFSRGLIVLVSFLAGCVLFCYLSPVLLPFLAAAVVASLLNPLCNFLQNTCRLRIRVLCVVLTLVMAIGFISGLLWLCLPPMFHELSQFRDMITDYFAGNASESGGIPDYIREAFNSRLSEPEIRKFLENPDSQEMIRAAVPGLWDALRSTAGILVSALASLIAVLYLFFILLDYERYAKGWTAFVPAKHRPFVRGLIDDIVYYMCGYFRGQFFIALSNCIMFTVGFLIIGFPMPVALGCFIGIISFIPYLQVVGFVPAALFALLEASKTGENFWLLMGGVALVYIVVQVIQDVLVTPRVMGRIMGLSPAIVLLSLTTGAFVAGLVGLIVALPFTTIALTYYKRYVVKDAENIL